MKEQMAWLEVDDLHHAYADNKVLRGCSLQLDRGEWLGLAGLNGAGKTTLLQCICGLLKPAAGRVLVRGEDFAANPPKARRRLGTMLAAEMLPGELELEQYLDLVRSAHGVEYDTAIVRQLYQGFGLESFAAQRLARCSLGTRQKAAIVAAFIGTPEVVLLDEPFNGLDSESQQTAKQAFSTFLQQGALLMASHTLEIIHEWCTRLICLVDGQIVESIDLNLWRQSGGGVRDLEQHVLAQRSRGRSLSA